MKTEHIGFLHPGAMGISLAATAQNTGLTACWNSADRSQTTRERAEKFNLLETQRMQELCELCTVIICVCPPHSATQVAQQVLHCGFKGLYADVNAVSPDRVKQIGRMVVEAGATFVDGGIIGGPAREPGRTWLYLSGPEADRIAACFAGGPLETEVIGAEIGKASALKMCYAANTKGTTALLCAVVAAAEGMGVRKELEKQWSRRGSEFAQNTLDRIRNVTAKAWRFSGEMEEIAATLESAGLPNGFHLAACDTYRRIAEFKDAESLPEIEDVLQALLHPDFDLDFERNFP